MLVDECTSGVDPLSRRALWKTLTSFRDDRCIIFTTHVSLFEFFLYTPGHLERVANSSWMKQIY